MENNTKKSKENRSMYLYTALIFVVALLLILLAFFGQTNVSRLGNRANELAPSSETIPSTAAPTSEEFAKVSNMAVALDKENKELKDKLAVSENLMNANELASKEMLMEAQEVLDTIDGQTLTEPQKVLYEQVKDKIAEGEEN